jgi:16S rRNA (guanine(966)-N(2))-methyltransferase RsmD
MDRAKEALFNILAPRIPGCAFLDLFAGTGGVGIEALSRGAARATFVEHSGAIMKDLQYNLERTRLADRAGVRLMNVFDFLDEPPSAFDVVFIAPPQWQGLWPRALARVDAVPEWLSDSGCIVVQHDPKEYTTLELRHFVEYDQRKYGGVNLVFYERR